MTQDCNSSSTPVIIPQSPQPESIISTNINHTIKLPPVKSPPPAPVKSPPPPSVKSPSPPVKSPPPPVKLPPPSSSSSSSSSSSRYENQKRRDWNTFGQYLRDNRPTLPLSRCTGINVLEFLRYLDQFGKTVVHTPFCKFYGQPTPKGPCTCPSRQAWGSLDAIVGRLRAAYEENGGDPDDNPFGALAVRRYLLQVRDSQAQSRGVSFFDTKKRKRITPSPAMPPAPLPEVPKVPLPATPRVPLPRRSPVSEKKPLPMPEKPRMPMPARPRVPLPRRSPVSEKPPLPKLATQRLRPLLPMPAVPRVPLPRRTPISEKPRLPISDKTASPMPATPRPPPSPRLPISDKTASPMPATPRPPPSPRLPISEKRPLPRRLRPLLPKPATTWLGPLQAVPISAVPWQPPPHLLPISAITWLRQPPPLPMPATQPQLTVSMIDEKVKTGEINIENVSDE